MPLPELPPLSISYSALRVFTEECERRWWHEHVGMWRGWERHNPAIPAEARLAYEGKHLVTLAQALGQGVHAMAERVGEAWRSGLRGVPKEAILADLRDAMNSLWARPRAAFLARPKLGYLLPRYYDLPISPGDVEVTRIKMQAAARRLASADVFGDLADCAKGDILKPETLQSVPLDVDGGPPVPLYGRADLLYIARRTLRVDGVLVAPGPTGIPVLTDYKTGRATAGSAEAEHALRLQMGVLALVAQLMGVAPHPILHYVARIVDLSPQAGPEDLVFALGPQDIERARDLLRAGVGRILALPRDGRGVIERDATELAYNRPRSCPSCGVRAACELAAPAWRRGAPVRPASDAEPVASGGPEEALATPA